MRICIVTPALMESHQDNDIGVIYHSLALVLAQSGHDITILYAPSDQLNQIDISFWCHYYQQKKIRFVLAHQDNSISYYASSIVQQSYNIYQWLRMESFEIIHFSESKGYGFFSFLAKQQGLYFKDTIMCISIHNPSSWHRVGIKAYTESLENVELDFLERESVAMADIVVSSNFYLLDWIRGEGWRLPEQIWIHPNLSNMDEQTSKVDSVKLLAVNELVFFGQLEWRKGVILFCDAVDKLEETGLCDFKVTFLGKTATINGQDSESYLRKRTSNWSWPVRFITDMDQHGAIRYLSSGLRMAVIPSLLENSPHAVQNCLYAGVPFLASNVGGTSELIFPEDRPHALFAIRADQIADKLQKALREGINPARPAISLEDNVYDWLNWHNTICVPKSLAMVDDHDDHISAPPLVSVCMTHFNRPLYLSYAIKSIKAQDYQNLEIILVDDGSTDQEALNYLETLESDFATRGWRLIRQQNRYLGAARNTAAHHARGEFLVFMDDDNVAKPHELSTFVKAAQVSGADILTCFIDAFRGKGEPGSYQVPGARSLPIGGASAVGMFRNCFGDANALIRRNVFEALGGFTEDYGVGHEDWEFFARAVLKGYRLQVVPEPLFWYRMAEDSMVNTTPRYENHIRPLRPYLETVPVVMRDLIHFAYGLFFHAFAYPNQQVERPAGGHGGDIETWQALVDEYWDSTSWRLLRPLRSAILRSRGLPAESRPRISSAQEALQVITMIRDSTSWELMGPMRVLSHAVRGMTGRLKA
ncbi:MAG TPA: glycosyltransferase [Candidatus Competibacter sp.]|nr:glycosyltransferase [Candidatus Competibacteraceae bacterium]HRW64221.1 glycosyltransferase [Candidatus Competibacter sp.]